MNVVARAQLTFQMLTTVNISNVNFTYILYKYLYHQSQYLKTWDSKCLALIAQMIRSFGMNPKHSGSSPPQVDTFFCLKNFDTFTRTFIRVSIVNNISRAQLNFKC